MARVCGVWWRADVCVPLCVSCEQEGHTPLWVACSDGDRDVALRLLHLGADPLIKDNDVSPPLLPCVTSGVCGVRGVYGHVCGGRVTGRVLRGTRGSTCEKSHFYVFSYILRHGKTNISLDSKCLYVFLLMRYSIFNVRNHGVCVVVCCS